MRTLVPFLIYCGLKYLDYLCLHIPLLVCLRSGGVSLETVFLVNKTNVFSSSNLNISPNSFTKNIIINEQSNSENALKSIVLDFIVAF